MKRSLITLYLFLFLSITGNAQINRIVNGIHIGEDIELAKQYMRNKGYNIEYEKLDPTLGEYYSCEDIRFCGIIWDGMIVLVDNDIASTVIFLLYKDDYDDYFYQKYYDISSALGNKYGKYIQDTSNSDINGFVFEDNFTRVTILKDYDDDGDLFMALIYDDLYDTNGRFVDYYEFL